ncbi:MAG: site-2 protease family protein [Candidatus Omnitrophica bacterium]|nr:site-2 protease family protein [Candidatus Omnitrophota bacterium]
MVSFFIIALIFFFSIILHECAHGWVAYRLGDPTAKEQGRLTLNPIKHVDFFGTIVLPLMLVVIGSPIILGWAKPVPVNFSRLRNPKKDMMLVGLSGPMTNICLAFILSIILKSNIFPFVSHVLQIGVVLNLVLAIFNLIPIPPLDGSRFVMGLLSARYAYYYAKLERYGIVIVFLLLYFGVLNRAVWPVVAQLSSYLGVQI